MPLSHSVPDIRLELPSAVARHEPSKGLPVTSDPAEPMAAGVCTYLGAPCRRYLKPDRQPILAYLFTADAIGHDAPAFPCDLGGYVRDAAGDARDAIGTHVEARNWVSELLDAAPSLSSFLDWDWTPPEGALQPCLRGYARGSDPATFTPEVRSTSQLLLTGTNVQVALVGTPVSSALPDRLLATINGLRETYAELDALGIKIEPFNPRAVEAPYRALHRAAGEWISRNAPAPL